MSRLATVVSGTVTSLALALAAGVAAVSSAELDDRESRQAGVGTIKLSTSQVALGGKVKVTGKLPPKAKRKVVLQRKAGGSWKAVANKLSSKKGKFSFSYKPTALGTHILRVKAPKTVIGEKAYPAVTTKTKTLTVTGSTPSPSPTPTLTPTPSGNPTPSQTPTTSPTPTPPPAGALLAVTHGDEQSNGAAISADGRYVTFSSAATDLVPGDTNGLGDVFVREMTTGVTSQITHGNGFSYVTSISPDGRHVAFSSFATDLVPGDTDTNGHMDVFVHDLVSHTTQRLTDGNGDSYDPSISADGLWVAFTSDATDLVAGDTNDENDVFLLDVANDTIVAVTEGEAGSGHAAISADGAWVAFESNASDLVAGDTNAAMDVFLHQRGTSTITRVSTPGDNHSEAVSISADGRYVAFESLATNLVAGDTNNRRDIFVYDRVGAAMTRVTNGNDHSHQAALSGDGSVVAFQSTADDLVSGDTNEVADIFAVVLSGGGTTRLVDGDDYSANPVLSGTGRYVAFESAASNLVPTDTNGVMDVFRLDRTP